MQPVFWHLTCCCWWLKFKPSKMTGSKAQGHLSSSNQSGPIHKIKTRLQVVIVECQIIKGAHGYNSPSKYNQGPDTLPMGAASTLARMPLLHAPVLFIKLGMAFLLNWAWHMCHCLPLLHFFFQANPL